MHAHTYTAVGRRKTSVARIILAPGSGKFTVNRRSLEVYFPLETLRGEVMKPLETTQLSGKFDVRVTVEGGGSTGQAGAIKLGIARALVDMSEDHKPPLRAAGLLTRCPSTPARRPQPSQSPRCWSGVRALLR